MNMNFLTTKTRGWKLCRAVTEENRWLVLWVSYLLDQGEDFLLVLVSVNNMENDLEVLCEQCFSAYAVLCCLTFDMIDSSSVNEHFQSDDLVRQEYIHKRV